MKRLALCLAALIFLLPAFCVSAYDGIQIALDDDFEIWQAGNSDFGVLPERLSMTAEQLSAYCEENNVELLAADRENRRQIRVQSEKTEFSEETHDLSGCNEAQIGELAETLTNGTEYKIVQNSSQKFIRIENTLTDGGGKYTNIQYITVAGGRVYTLTFYTDASVSTDYAEKAFSGFSIDYFTDSHTTGGESLKTALIIAGIVITAAVTAVIAVTVVRDLRKKEQ